MLPILPEFYSKFGINNIKTAMLREFLAVWTLYHYLHVDHKELVLLVDVIIQKNDRQWENTVSYREGRIVCHASLLSLSGYIFQLY